MVDRRAPRFALYVYSVEVERGRFDLVLAALAFWLMDWFNVGLSVAGWL